MYPPQGGHAAHGQPTQPYAPEPWPQQPPATPYAYTPPAAAPPEPRSWSLHSPAPHRVPDWSPVLNRNAMTPNLAVAMAARPLLKRKGPLGALVLVVLVALAVGAVLVLPVGAKSSDPRLASVGDCVAGDVNVADSIKTVACTDTSATFKVIGTKPFQSESAFEASQNPCSDHPSANTAFWEGKAGKHGTVLCLQKLSG